MKRQTSETLVSGLDGGEDIGVRVGMLIPASVQHLDKHGFQKITEDFRNDSSTTSQPCFMFYSFQYIYIYIYI